MKGSHFVLLMTSMKNHSTLIWGSSLCLKKMDKFLLINDDSHPMLKYSVIVNANLYLLVFCVDGNLVGNAFILLNVRRVLIHFS